MRRCVLLLSVLPALGRAQPTPRLSPADTFVPRDAQVIALWPHGAPGAVGDSSVDRPTITVFRAPRARATGAAALIFPGGGYGHIATGKEGVATAHWLNALGISAFLVHYRLGDRYHHPAMLDDGQRALRTVRARAAEWDVDPTRIGVVGFSAGGHLASTVGTQFQRRASGDAIDSISARPDFMVLVYPVITMDSAFMHRGSRDRLLGSAPDSALVQSMSSERQVTAATPPTLLVASTDDATVPVENTLRFYAALRAAKVPVELHVFESGRHGFALAPSDPRLAQWLTLAAAWFGRRRLSR